MQSTNRLSCFQWCLTKDSASLVRIGQNRPKKTVCTNALNSCLLMMQVFGPHDLMESEQFSLNSCSRFCSTVERCCCIVHFKCVCNCRFFNMRAWALVGGTWRVISINNMQVKVNLLVLGLNFQHFFFANSMMHCDHRFTHPLTVLDKSTAMSCNVHLDLGSVSPDLPRSP